MSGRGEPAPGGWRWQMSLRSMVVWVLAAGVAASLVADSREVWGTRPTHSVLLLPSFARPLGGTLPMAPVPVTRTAGVLLEVAAVLAVVFLARDLFTLAQGGGAAMGIGAAPRVLAIGWRAAAIGLLVWFVSHELSVLRLDFATEVETSDWVPGWDRNYTVRQDLLPVCGLLMMLGLALLKGADPLIGGSSLRRARPWWLFAPLAAIVALLIVGQTYFAVMPYLVLVALDAVTTAMRYRIVPSPSLSTRLIHAGMNLAIGGAIILALALVVARDFDRARRGLPWGNTARGVLCRVVVVLAAAAAGVYLAQVVMPAIHPCLRQGYAAVIRSNEVYAVLAGFGVFAVGLAARSLDPGPAWEKPRWLARLAIGMRLVVVALLLESGLKCFPSSTQVEHPLPRFWAMVFDGVENAHAWLWERFPDELVIMMSRWLEPECLIWTLMLAGLAALLVDLAIRPTEAGAAPFDRVLAQPGSAWRLAWLASGLVTVCLAALPALVIAGHVIYHLRLNAEDLAYFGWPR